MQCNGTAFNYVSFNAFTLIFTVVLYWYLLLTTPFVINHPSIYLQHHNITDSNNLNNEMTSQVKFVRSTMLRMVIEGNTKSDMTKWLKDYYSDIERVSGALLDYSYHYFTLVLSLSHFSCLLSLILYLSHSHSSLVLTLSDCVFVS
jgi:hypothetical protein